MIVTAYRISRAAYAAAIWSGTGARDYGGRWNSKGVPLVYTAQNRSLAAMEQLVHLIPPRVLKGYVMASVTFDDALARPIDPATLPRGWNAPVAPARLRKYGDEWVAKGAEVVLAVPNAVMPGEWNYLLNPAHPDFAWLAKSAPEPFVFGSRLI